MGEREEGRREGRTEREEEEVMTELTTSGVVVAETVTILPTTRASVALDYVIINEKNKNNDYITSFCQQKEILKTLDTMVCRSKAVKQLMNVNGLKKEITEVRMRIPNLYHAVGFITMS